MTITAHSLKQSRYAEWLTDCDLRFGFASEIAALANRTRLKITNDTPPVELWHRILPTVKIVEQVREQFGATSIHSAYRSLTYNVAVGGVGDSQHSKNDAIDFSCALGNPEHWGQYLKNLRATGAFAGGIGIYKTFVHVDTRGKIADWRG